MEPRFVISASEAESQSISKLLPSLVSSSQSLARPSISNFPVAAVGLAASGRIFVGVNVEFPGLPFHHTIHAEQFLLTNMANNAETRLDSFAVSAAPCGHCRQFLQELRDAPDIQILITSHKNPHFSPLSHFLSTTSAPTTFSPKPSLSSWSLVTTLSLFPKTIISTLLRLRRWRPPITLTRPTARPPPASRFSIPRGMFLKALTLSPLLITPAWDRFRPPSSPSSPAAVGIMKRLLRRCWWRRKGRSSNRITLQASAAFLHIIGSYKLQVYNYSLFSCYNPWFSLPPAESGKVDLVPKVQGITGSSTLSKEKKLTLPSVTRQIFKGMPPHCFSRASISALDGGFEP
ncbi:hypothetical protein JHK82_043377 [Glycine max]|nr:hypothetical protein JHK82_043377 [Glycine max]